MGKIDIRKDREKVKEYICSEVVIWSRSDGYGWELLKECRQLGRCECLTKPIFYEDLVKTAHEAIDKRLAWRM